MNKHIYRHKLAKTKKKIAHLRRMKEHARLRFKERFNINLNKNNREDIIRLCIKSNSIESNKAGRKCKINYQNINMTVIYNKTSNCIITAFPTKDNEL